MSPLIGEAAIRHFDGVRAPGDTLQRQNTPVGMTHAIGSYCSILSRTPCPSRPFKEAHRIMWDILAWIIAGGAVGVLATLTMQGANMGIVMDIFVGVIGASLAGALLTFLVPSTFVLDGFNLVSLLVALAGAVLLLALIRAVSSPRQRAA